MGKVSLVGALPFTLKNGFIYELGELTRYYSNIWKVKEGKVEIVDRSFLVACFCF